MHLFSFLIKSIVTVIAVSILPLIGVYSVVDISQRYMEDRELKQITLFLMTMAKWSGVKNDLVYCLKKTCETGMKKPMGRIIDTALGRIYGGMPPVAAFGLMEKEASSEDFRYLVKNIRFAAEKGGNLQLLFKGMEEQYFKRKISTLRDRVAVYLTIFMVITTGIWFIGSNPAASAYYLNTVNGNLMLLAFVVIFGFGIMIMMKR